MTIANQPFAEPLLRRSVGSMQQWQIAGMATKIIPQLLGVLIAPVSIGLQAFANNRLQVDRTALGQFNLPVFQFFAVVNHPRHTLDEIPVAPRKWQLLP